MNTMPIHQTTIPIHQIIRDKRSLNALDLGVMNRVNSQLESQLKSNKGSLHDTFKIVSNGNGGFDQHFILDLKPVSRISNAGVSLESQKNHDESVLVARPLKELSQHIKNWKLPSFALVARCIKTLVLGIFKGHLCDHVLLRSNDSIIHSLNGRISTENSSEFVKTYPFLLESAYVLKPKVALPPNFSKQDELVESLGKITPDAVRKYFLIAHKFDITDRLESINDLFAAKQLTLS